MRFCTYVKIRKIGLIIISPIVILYFSGLLGMKNWITTVFELHEKAHKENKTSQWFAKKCVLLYLRVALFSCINIAAWFYTIYLLTK